MLIGSTEYLRSAAHKCREAANLASSPYSPMIHQLADRLDRMARQQQTMASPIAIEKPQR